MSSGAGSSVWWAFCVDTMQTSGLGTTQSRVVYAVCGAALLLGSVSGLAFARLGLRAGYCGATVLLAASLGLLAVATDQLVWALVAAVAFGACYASVIAAHGIWSTRVFAEHPAAGPAAVSAALTIGTLVGPPLAGLAIQQSGHALALIGAPLVTVAAVPFCPPSQRRCEVLADHDQALPSNAARPQSNDNPAALEQSSGAEEPQQ